MNAEGTGQEQPHGNVPLQLWLLVGVMALIELVLSAADSGWIGAANWREIAFGYGAFWRVLLHGGAVPSFSAQPYIMFISYAFLHGSWFHFLMNGVVLLALGKLVCDRSGPWFMLFLFFVSAVAAGGLYALLSRSDVPMVGASGAAFGFIGIWQFWEYSMRRAYGLSLRPVFATLGGLVLINVALAFALQGGLAWQAHLGGFIAGFALGKMAGNPWKPYPYDQDL